MYEHHFNALENTFFLNICLICNVLICLRTLVSAELLENHKCKQKKVKQKWRKLLSNNDIDPENKNKKRQSMECFQIRTLFPKKHWAKDSRFLPAIPSPVPDHQTVYTALKNFQDILKQLSQTHLAVTCDEGVYHTAREITMGNAAEFENIVLCLGTFHMTKYSLDALENIYGIMVQRAYG